MRDMMQLLEECECRTQVLPENFDAAVGLMEDAIDKEGFVILWDEDTLVEDYMAACEVLMLEEQDKLSEAIGASKVPISLSERATQKPGAKRSTKPGFKMVFGHLQKLGKKGLKMGKHLAKKYGKKAQKVAHKALGAVKHFFKKHSKKPAAKRRSLTRAGML